MKDYRGKGIFYGTSAADGLPSPFCSCYLCEYARAHGGKDLRTRSAFRLEEDLFIDMGADAFTQAMNYGDFTKLEHVLITHTHEDHFAYMMLALRKMATHRRVKTLHIYMMEEAMAMVEEMRKNPVFIKGGLPGIEADGIVSFHSMKFGEAYDIGGRRVVPLRGHHFGNMGDQCANFLITLPNGKVFYYGLDTGAYETDTLAYLKDRPIDIFISECTYGDGEDTYPDPGHLSFSTALRTIRQLEAQNSLAKDCKIYLTHINHMHTAHHKKLQHMCDTAGLPYGFYVAYDGMEIDL